MGETGEEGGKLMMQKIVEVNELRFVAKEVKEKPNSCCL